MNGADGLLLVSLVSNFETWNSEFDNSFNILLDSFSFLIRCFLSFPLFPLILTRDALNEEEFPVSKIASKVQYSSFSKEFISSSLSTIILTATD